MPAALSERRPPWMISRPCAHCRSRAWRTCLVCERPCCSQCRVGRFWTWSCVADSCRAGFAEAKREKRRAELAARTLQCLRCFADFTRSLVRWGELHGAEDVVRFEYRILQRPACGCANLSAGVAERRPVATGPPAARREA